MKLTVDHTQRLNLHAFLRAQGADVGSIRAIWAVQDRLALNAEEEKAIDLKREMAGGQERVAWKPSLSIPAKEFDFADTEVGSNQGGYRNVGRLRSERRSSLAPAALDSDRPA